MNAIKKYWLKIKQQELLVSEKIEMVYDQNIKILKDEDPKYYFNEKLANKAIIFIESFCKHSKGAEAGNLFKLALWQKAMISLIFGIVHRKTDLRKYKEVMLIVARKNGKTTLAAAIELYMAIGDGELGADCYSVATTKDQAEGIFEEIQNMVRQSNILNKRLRKTKKTLFYDEGLSQIRVLPGRSDNLDGKNPHFVNIDELHAIKDRGLYSVITTSFGARRQPLLLITTTAGSIRGNVYDDQYSYAVDIINGSIKDEAYLALIYELDSEKNWNKEKMWIKANPNLGISKYLDDMKRQFKMALKNKSTRPGFLSKHLNIRTTTVNNFLTFKAIDANKKFYDISTIYDKYCVIGYDLSKTTDLTAVTILVPLEEEEIFTLTFFFIPDEIAEERELEDNIPYIEWATEGWVMFTPGAVIDQDFIFEFIIEFLEENELTPLQIGYDSWNATHINNKFKEYGYPMEEVRQGAKTLSAPMKMLGAKMIKGKVIYNNNPCMYWNFTNVGFEEDKNENIIPKKISQRKRIDGFASLLNAYVAYERTREKFEALQ